MVKIALEQMYFMKGIVKMGNEHTRKFNKSSSVLEGPDRIQPDVTAASNTIEIESKVELKIYSKEIERYEQYGCNI